MGRGLERHNAGGKGANVAALAVQATADLEATKRLSDDLEAQIGQGEVQAETLAEAAQKKFPKKGANPLEQPTRTKSSSLNFFSLFCGCFGGVNSSAPNEGTQLIK